MASSWRRPGRIGELIYTGAATVVGFVTSSVSRLQIALKGDEPSAPRRTQRLPSGPIIVVSNHTSYADGVLFVLACRRLGRSVRMLVTAGVFRTPVLGWVLHRLGFVAVKRGGTDASQSLEPAAEALRHGEAVGLYPEGHLTKDPALWPERAKTGAVRLALMTDVPIVPMAMVGAHRVVGRTSTWLVPTFVVSLLRRPRVDVLVGSPIDVRSVIGLEPGAAAEPAQIRIAADAVMAELIRLVEELRGESAPDPLGIERHK